MGSTETSLPMTDARHVVAVHESVLLLDTDAERRLLEGGGAPARALRPWLQGPSWSSRWTSD